jgi:predicted acetyltransferase
VEATPITADEIPAFVETLYAAFHEDAPQDDPWRAVIEPERTLAIRDGGRIVATTGVYSRRLTVPGGELPFAAVALVGVLPSHRRRGLLTTLMRRQLDDVHAAGEPLAALWASETAIYGRFGYGLATLVGNLDVATREARLRQPPDRRVRLCTPEEARPAVMEIHEAVRRSKVGMLDRSDGWWNARLSLPEHQRRGGSALRAAVVDGEAYALYSTKSGFTDGRPSGEVMVRELFAAATEGGAAVWDFLLGLDLIRRLTYELAAADNPLPHMLTEAQAVRMRLGDGLWLRIVDVPAALERRSYAQPFEVTLAVSDEFCPWNEGTWTLAWDGRGATCERGGEPDLALSAADLGAVYLGGTTLDQLARARRVRELRPGTLAPASLAFRGERAPWCPEIF